MKRVRLIYRFSSGYEDVFQFPSLADLYRFLIREKEYLYNESCVEFVTVSVSRFCPHTEYDLCSITYDLDYSGISFDDFCALVYSLYEVNRDE